MTIKVKVVPRAKKEKIEKVEDVFKVYMTEPAIENRANKKLIEMIAEHFKVKKYNISIIKGLKNREKTIEII
ncbi:MAG: DUF167 domain-containing protein [Candidatus Omnitrophota bacterium]|jgi:hypothetical protein